MAEVWSAFPARASSRRSGAAAASASGPRDRRTPGSARGEGKGHLDRLLVGGLPIRQGRPVAARRRLEASQVAPAVHHGDRGGQFGPAGSSSRSPGRDPCDRACLPCRSRDAPSLWRRARGPSAPSSRRRRRSDRRARSGAGQDTINRLAAQVQRWLEEIDPLGNARYAATDSKALYRAGERLVLTRLCE